jgi:hypothetical protein
MLSVDEQLEIIRRGTNSDGIIIGDDWGEQRGVAIGAER